jgi:Flp pilus assembly protein TadG
MNDQNKTTDNPELSPSPTNRSGEIFQPATNETTPVTDNMVNISTTSTQSLTDTSPTKNNTDNLVTPSNPPINNNIVEPQSSIENNALMADSFTPVIISSKNSIWSSFISALKHRKPSLLIPMGILLILVLGGISYGIYIHSHPVTKASQQATATLATAPTSYQSVIQEFVTALQNGNKNTADTLQSSTFSQANLQQYGSTSFYSACVSIGTDCTGAFVQSYLANAMKASNVYISESGTKGDEIDYTVTVTPSGSSGNSNTLTIGVVPNGKSWLIDYVNESGSIATSNANTCENASTSST